MTTTHIVQACPECNGSTVYQREWTDGGRRVRDDERWRCHECGAAFGTPKVRPPKDPGRGVTPDRSWTVCRECEAELRDDGSCPWCERYDAVMGCADD